MNIRLHNLSKALDIEISGLFVNHGDVFPSYLRLLIEAKALKAFRNKIVHSDPSGLLALSELYERFHRANTLLRPSGFVGDTEQIQALVLGLPWRRAGSGGSITLL